MGIVLTLTFVLMKLIPGSPFSDEKDLPDEVLKALESQYKLNHSFLSQFFFYVLSALKLDFGQSMQYSDLRVSDIILDRFPISFLLGTEALLFSFSFGILLGSIAAYQKGTGIERGIYFLTMALISLPSFCLGILLQYLLSIKLGWLPIAHFNNFAESILPVLALSSFPIAYITTLVKDKLSETLKMTYIKTAFTKGLHPFTIITKHVLPNSLLPLFGFGGQLVANILVGSFVVEKIFAIPGLGGSFVNSIFARDYSTIMGLTLFYALILTLSVFISELLALWVNPREWRKIS